MTLSAFGVSVAIPEPSYPYIRPKRPAQTIHDTSGRAIYTTTQADISPLSLDLIIDDLTLAERDSLSDFIENVIGFSSHPCTITTDIDTHTNMHLIGGWDTITDRKGDIANVRLRFRESTPGIHIGKNLLPHPRILASDGSLLEGWATTSSFVASNLSASQSPFGYSHQAVLFATASNAIYILPEHAFPLVGTDLQIKCRMRKQNNAVSNTALSLRFYAAKAHNEAQVGRVTGSTTNPAHNVWQTLLGVIEEGDIPAGANFFTPEIQVSGAVGREQIAEITCEYKL